MDTSALQGVLNSVIGVIAAIMLISKMFKNWRKNLLGLVGNYLFFMVGNTLLMLDRTTVADSIFRAILIAALPMIFGYVMAIVWSKYNRQS